jgi:hypothetical protein
LPLAAAVAVSGLSAGAHDLKDAAGNGYPDGDEDQAAGQLAPLAGLGAEPVPSSGPAREKVGLTFAASVVMLVRGHP